MYYLGCKTRLGKYHDVCQDSSGCMMAEDFSLVVVADGVGSAKFSQVGSEIAKNIVLNEICDEINGNKNNRTTEEMARKLYNYLPTYFQKVVDSIKACADDNGESVGEYATTLSVFVIYKDYLIWGHSGDGAIITITADKMVTELTTEHSGRFAGEVFTLLSGREMWSFGIKENDTIVCMAMTDGVLKHFNRVNCSSVIDQYYEVLLNLANEFVREEKNPEVLIDMLLDQRADVDDPYKDDESLGIWVDLDKEFDDDSMFYYARNKIQDVNMDNELFEKKQSDIMTYLKSDHIFYDNQNNTIFSLGKSSDGIYIRGMVSCASLNLFLPSERLHKMLELVREYIVSIKLYTEQEYVSDSIENREQKLTELDEIDPELCAYLASNQQDIRMALYETKNYIIFEFDICEYMIRFTESIISILATYRYQLGSALAKIIVLRNNQQGENTKYDDVHITEDYLNSCEIAYVSKSFLIEEYKKRNSISKTAVVIEEEIVKKEIAKKDEDNEYDEDDEE